MKNILCTLAFLSACLVFSVQGKAQSVVADTAASNEFKVINITCDGDMPTIKKQLLNQDGITDVNFTTRKNGMSTFTVQFEPGITDRKGIIRIIETTPGCDDKSSTPYRVKKQKGS